MATMFDTQLTRPSLSFLHEYSTICHTYANCILAITHGVMFRSLLEYNLCPCAIDILISP